MKAVLLLLSIGIAAPYVLILSSQRPNKHEAVNSNLALSPRTRQLHKFLKLRKLRGGTAVERHDSFSKKKPKKRQLSLDTDFDLSTPSLHSRLIDYYLIDDDDARGIEGALESKKIRVQESMKAATTNTSKSNNLNIKDNDNGVNSSSHGSSRFQRPMILAPSMTLSGSAETDCDASTPSGESSVRSVVTKEFGVDFVSQGDKVKREVGRYGNDTEKLCDEQLTSSSLFEEPTQLP
eukprot:jgi/Bigna1/144444/aug1.87_g19152